MCFLLMTPCASWAQGVPATTADKLRLYDRIVAFMPVLSGMQSVDVLRDSTFLHGSFSYFGASTTQNPDPAVMMARATNIADSVRAYFAIPPEYVWTMMKGGLVDRPLVATIGGDWKSVAFELTVDGVPVDTAVLDVQFDPQGKTRRIIAKVPRLRPEIVAAVRGPTIPESQLTSIIQTNANTLPLTNPFGVKPGAPVRLRAVRKIALVTAPYYAYETYVGGLLYRVNATNGVILKRLSMVRN